MTFTGYCANNENVINVFPFSVQQKLLDTKRVTRGRKLMDRQYNDQQKDKQPNHIISTKHYTESLIEEHEPNVQ
jgi:hypothetical protein